MSRPEGTRSRDGRLGQFKRGPFTMAQRVGVRIVPVTITGVTDAMPPFAMAPLRKVSNHGNTAVSRVCTHCCIPESLVPYTRRRIEVDLPRLGWILGCEGCFELDGVCRATAVLVSGLRIRIPD